VRKEHRRRHQPGDSAWWRYLATGTKGFNCHIKSHGANDSAAVRDSCSGELLALRLDSPFKSAPPERDVCAANKELVTDIKGLVGYIKSNIAKIDTDGNHLIDKLEIEKTITNAQLDSNQALAAAFLYYYRKSLGKDTLNADS
jgi:hypothetical protein